MIAEAADGAWTLFFLPILIGLIVLAVMAILMPYYVYKCRHLLQDLKDKADEQITETKRTNNLLRQLIRAYGHEPDC
jgi:hypothetical protein